MNERRAILKPCELPGKATAEDGVVVLDGPDGVAVTMTPEAAELTAESLHAAAAQARQGPGTSPGLKNDGELH
jgi:hypothetical protein